MKAHLSRRYHFSASHRLHTEAYDEARNRAVFGKCNNPNGHGHNYVVEVTLSGQVDTATGMVVDLAELDAFAQESLIKRFDHTNLNLLDCFEETVSTSENLAVELFRVLCRFPPVLAARVMLENVHLEETGKNSFDFAGGAVAAESKH